MKSKTPSTGPATIKQRVVVNDSSCLIDLRKVNLLGEMLGLPYLFVVAYPLRQNELLDIDESEWAHLQDQGMKVIDLSGDQVVEAIRLRGTHGGLSAEDCFSVVLAKSLAGSILLTGDAQLRRVSSDLNIEVHGVLWVAEQLFKMGAVDKARLQKCAASWRADSTVFVHERLIDELLARCV